MAIRKGTCRICERTNVDVIDDDSKCIICKRLDSIEKKIKELESFVL